MIFLVVGLLGSSLAGLAQSLQGRAVMGREGAAQELRQALKDTSETRKIAGQGHPIPTSRMAVAVAEPVLFRVYGKKQIRSERPYETYLIDHYWVISGTLPQGSKGGNFLIVLDARNSRVVEVTHYK